MKGFQAPYATKPMSSANEALVVDAHHRVVCRVALPPGDYRTDAEAFQARCEFAEKIARLLNDASVWESIRPVV